MKPTPYDHAIAAHAGYTYHPRVTAEDLHPCIPRILLRGPSQAGSTVCTAYAASILMGSIGELWDAGSWSRLMIADPRTPWSGVFEVARVLGGPVIADDLMGAGLVSMIKAGAQNAYAQGWSKLGSGMVSKDSPGHNWLVIGGRVLDASAFGRPIGYRYDVSPHVLGSRYSDVRYVVIP